MAFGCCDRYRYCFSSCLVLFFPLALLRIRLLWLQLLFLLFILLVAVALLFFYWLLCWLSVLLSPVLFSVVLVCIILHVWSELLLWLSFVCCSTRFGSCAFSSCIRLSVVLHFCFSFILLSAVFHGCWVSLLFFWLLGVGFLA